MAMAAALTTASTSLSVSLSPRAALARLMLVKAPKSEVPMARYVPGGSS